MRFVSSRKRRGAEKRQKLAREPLLVPGTTCFAVLRGRSGVIVDADAYYRALADAIESATSYVLLAGWQLESTVLLRRRPEDAGRPRTLGEIVRAAALASPDLQFRVLAWDWSKIYALDREWGTKQKLEEAGQGRLRFLHDRSHPQGASQHDKIVVVDGHTAWIGGIDLCEHRWDDREHRAVSPFRLDGKGRPYGPYHDVQAVTRGPVVRAIVEHFVDRWVAAGGEPMVLVPEREPADAPFAHVALGRRSSAWRARAARRSSRSASRSARSASSTCAPSSARSGSCISSRST
jgi:phosphatidylserine/phosphatidylglycerophosphate/cardiolipin synthase-like enzyme